MYIDPDDLSEPGIFGKIHFIHKDGPFDDEGDPVTTPELVRAYNNRLGMLETGCLGILVAAGLDTWPHKPSPDAPERTKDAYLAVRALHNLKKCVRKFDQAGCVMWAFEVGRIEERGNARWAEELVMHERARQHEVKEKKRKKQEKARARFATLRADDPYGDKGPLVERIMSEQKISKRSAEIYLAGLK